ncbi:MAG: hypothetical protein AB2689_19675 [Candidatus Thiodiazotropha taylori]
MTDYKGYVNDQEMQKIIEFLRQRFTERYIEPMRVDLDKKNGFTIMAVSCLMIESLESFYQGWGDSNSKSQLAFCYFFDRNPNFVFIKGYSQEFYKCVRCGILHQGETTKGWHIRRDGKVFNEKTKTINAKIFHDEVENSLSSYCDTLQGEAWNSETWKRLRKKMKAVCRNCES